MPGKDVYNASLADDRKRDFRNEYPSVGRRQVARDEFVKGGVPSVQEPIENAAAPSGDHLEPHLERRRHPLDGVQGHAPDLTTLDLGHDPARDTGTRRDICLTPAAADANRAESRAGPGVTHGRSIDPSSCPRLYRALPPRIEKGWPRGSPSRLCD